MSDGPHTEVAVVGAGPYGLSLAAHLRFRAVDFRIFGSPMIRWRRHMPAGMCLKSDGFASNLSDPAGSLTLAHYCARVGLPYSDTGLPVPLDTFTRYALEFHRRLVPEVEDVLVERIALRDGGFWLRLAGGESFSARRVVLAVGLEYAAYVPPQLAALPAAVLSHSSAVHDPSRFRGREVTVIGAGQSALETAALVAEQDAAVRLLARAPAVAWNLPPREGGRSLFGRLRYPASGLGAGIQLWGYCNAPGAFRFLPRQIRLDRVKNVLGPAGAWWLKDRVMGRVTVLPDHVVTNARASGGRAMLEVRRGDGRRTTFAADHVIAATGYRFDVDRIPFLGEELKRRVRTGLGWPVLSTSFESTVPGLYFTGLASALSFGPVMRFLEGADYTARRIARHLRAGRSPAEPQPQRERVHAVES
jgi:FAD-dependent urate hydroxylase